MTGREKVLKGLECCSKYTGDECDNCPYDSACKPKKGGRNPLMVDALALLKSQEPVEPTLRGGIGGYWYCGACNYQISRGDKFCRYCGQAVKWE